MYKSLRHNIRYCQTNRVWLYFHILVTTRTKNNPDLNFHRRNLTTGLQLQLGMETHCDGSHLWWKMTFDGRQPIKEENIWLKPTFHGRQLLKQNDLLWKTTSDEKWPSLEDNLRWNKTLFYSILFISHEQPISWFPNMLLI